MPGLRPKTRAEADGGKRIDRADPAKSLFLQKATARYINNSDIDIFEHEGKCLISYSWGNQHRTEHLATAIYQGPLASFLEEWFPRTSVQQGNEETR